MNKLAIVAGTVVLVVWLATKPNHETLHKVAWELGVVDCILVAWSMFFSGSGH
jgi:hypothetical protein